MALTPKDIAQYFIHLNETLKGEEPSDLTNLKLQKLVYLAQGFNLGLHGKPLFNEEIEAWDYGPVVPSLYNEFKKYGANLIPAENIDLSIYDGQTKQLLNQVFISYGQYSAWKLSELTHEHLTWKNAYLNPDNKTISSAALQAYFPALIDFLWPKKTSISISASSSSRSSSSLSAQMNTELSIPSKEEKEEEMDIELEVVEKLSVLTSHKDTILRKLKAGKQHSKLEESLNTMFTQISTVENIFKESKGTQEEEKFFKKTKRENICMTESRPHLIYNSEGKTMDKKSEKSQEILSIQDNISKIDSILRLNNAPLAHDYEALIRLTKAPDINQDKAKLFVQNLRTYYFRLDIGLLYNYVAEKMPIQVLKELAIIFQAAKALQGLFAKAITDFPKQTKLMESVKSKIDSILQLLLSISKQLIKLYSKDPSNKNILSGFNELDRIKTDDLLKQTKSPESPGSSS